MPVVRRRIACGVILCVVSLGIRLQGATASVVQAVRAGDVSKVRALIQQKADVNAADRDGATALHWAAQATNVEILQLLLHGGARPNVTNLYGVTPLALGCLNASKNVVEALLKAGADPNLVAASGETPLMTAARTGSVGVVRALIEAGASVNASEPTGQTALMWAAAEGHARVVQELIRGGASIEARTKGKFTPLMFAARSSDVESTRALLAAGANVNDSAADGQTALIVAVGSNQLPTVTLLLDSGADVNAADRAGMTPLHASVWGITNVEMIRLLAARGAKPNPQTTGSIRQRQAAKFEGEIFRRYPGWASMKGATPMALAAAECNVDAMRALKAAGGDISIPLENGSTPLMLAAGMGWTFENSGMTYERALAGVHLLIEFGADVRVRNKGGRTALHGASNQGAEAIIQLLVDHGADVNAVDEIGWNPLWTAEHAKLGGSVLPQPAAMKLLRKLGAVDHPPAAGAAPSCDAVGPADACIDIEVD